MDILIPLGRGSTWQNNELRYCLRSIERYAIGYDRVKEQGSHAAGRIFIIGEIPEFLAHHSSLVTRHCSDIIGNKQARIAHKILWAFRHTDISDSIIFFNDDFVLNAPVDLRTLAYYQRGDLKEIAARQESAEYRGALEETHDALAAAGKATLHYDLHLPIIYDREKFLALSDWWKKSQASKFGYVVKSSYANHVLDGFPAESLAIAAPRTRDCKINAFSGSFDEKCIRSDRFCFSYSDGALACSGLKEWLEKRFPEKSVFEK